MRMAALELEVLGPRHVLDVEDAALLGYFGVEKDLEQDVPKLVLDLVPVPATQGNGQLRRLGAQARHGGDEVGEGFGHFRRP
jgi:hypothetical protein